MEIEVKAGFTLDGLLAELEEKEELPDYKTSGEWCEALGVSDVRLKRLLREAQKRGILSVSRAKRPCLDGATRMVPVYKITLRREG